MKTILLLVSGLFVLSAAVLCLVMAKGKPHEAKQGKKSSGKISVKQVSREQSSNTDFSIENIYVRLQSYFENERPYLDSNLTISDVKQLESEEEKTVEEEKFSEPQVEQEVEKEQIVLQETQEQSEPVKKLVIERPNYDFIGDKKTGTKKKKKSKLKAALLCCTLAACCVGCVTGSIVIDNLNSQYIELQDEYSLNLATYLRNINNLNATNQGLEFIETYPEDINEISSIGETTNWFDNLSNFIAGIFGG